MFILKEIYFETLKISKKSSFWFTSGSMRKPIISFYIDINYIINQYRNSIDNINKKNQLLVYSLVASIEVTKKENIVILIINYHNLS